MKSYRTNLTALLIAQTLAIMGFSLMLPIIPLFLEEDIGITDPVRLKVWVGFIHSSATIALAVFAPIWGRLADVFSRRVMLIRAMFCGSIVIFFMTFVTSPWQLLVLRGLQGSLAGTIAAATVLTASISPAAKVALAMGLLQTSIATGSSIGPLIGGIISDFLGYRAAFLSTSLLLALAGFVVLMWVEDDFRPSPENKAKKLSLLPDIQPIAGSPLLICIILLTLGVHTANTVATPMLPLFLRSLLLRVTEEPAFIASSTGIVLGTGAAFAAVAAVLAGKFSYRIGYWKTLIFCLSAAAVLTIPQAFVSNMLQLTILRAMTSFFIGGTLPVINAIIASSSEKKNQGTIYGFNSSMAYAGMALGPMIGSAAAMLSFHVMFFASALVLALSALGAFWRRGKHQ